jgi:molybdopterin-binding protein
MNRLKGHIKKTSNTNGLSLVEVEVSGLVLQSLIIDTEENPSFRVLDKVMIYFNSSEVIISKKQIEYSSIVNQIPCKIIDINRGKLLSILTLDFNSSEITATLISEKIDELKLNVNDTIWAGIKVNEIILAK